MIQGPLQPKWPNHFVQSISDSTPEMHQSSNKYPHLHLQTLLPFFSSSPSHSLTPHLIYAAALVASDAPQPSSPLLFS